ncbi:MAG: histidine kinase [Gemmatimonas sp. SG8_17]|nr:MAG: histidine kinase [Gemmatimonas sp. SG8_17]
MEQVIKLLIVDDESRFLDAIATRLRKRGFDVKTATNGPDAIALARDEKFDVALLDLKMPGMDGSEVLRVLKQEHEFLEAVILTGHGSLESAVELTKLGAFGYLPKPYELDKLLETLKEAYEARLKKKFGADEAKMKAILSAGLGESPLGILRKLRELDDGRR